MSHAITSPRGRTTRPRLSLRGPILLGLAVIALVIGGGIGAATWTPIDKGASLSGTVIVETKTRAIQHDRGGIIGAVHVVEGAEIKAGDLVATIDTSALQEQVGALRTQQKAALRQLDLMREEALLLGDLVKKQLTSRPRLVAAERTIAEIEKEAAGFVGRIAIVEQEVAKAEIRSPVAGRILALAVHGRGAVVAPGGIVAQIVPLDDRLVIEGRLSPALIDLVKPGLPAKVWLTGVAWRDSRPLPARLAWISPDAIEDRRTGLTYFTARVELTQSRREIEGRLSLHPGQRADILVVTGARTLFEQLLDPILRNVNRAFRI